MKYQLVASDLDGTFLNEKGVVCDKNWEAVSKMREKGVLFVPSSGRSFYEMPECIQNSPEIRYYITSDGTLVYDKEEDRSYEFAMSRDLGQWVFQHLKKQSVCMMLHADRSSYMDADLFREEDFRRCRMTQTWVEFAFAMNRPVERFSEFVEGLDNIQMICAFFEKEEELEACRKLFSADPRLNVVQSHPNNLEVYRKDAGKGTALYFLADLLGIPREATIAVGDSTNDSSMVMAAGLGLAVENAVEALKECADAVTCHHSEPVADYILRNYL